MSSYSPFLEEKSMNSSFEERFGLHRSPYAPPLTPTVSTPSSSSVSGFQHSLFTPPQVATESSSLHTLLQMAMQQSPSSPPPFKVPSEADYTAAAASLLSCLSAQAPAVRRSTGVLSKGGQSFDWLRPGGASTLARQVSTDSSSTGNPIVQALVNSPNQLTASSVQGKVMELATDRNGSRLLQKLLTQGGVDIVARVIDEVEFSLPIIMCDTYANYMCQQLFQAASARQRLRLLSRLAPRFTEVARDRRGTHSLQALISHISSVEEEDLLASILEGQIESTALDVHATHVLQQAISCCLAKPGPPRRLDFVFTEVSTSVEKLAVDPNALGVVKRCITHSQARGFASVIAHKIDSCMFEFVENPYANYAVQHALETWSASPDPSVVQLAEKLVLKLSDRIAPMSLHKFASNVAEMAIKSSSCKIRHILIEALQYEDDSRMLSLMRSPFGVFVVGTAIKFADDVQQSHSLTLAICKNLKKLPDGRNKTKWEKLLAECAYSHQFFSALAASVSAPPTPSTASDSASEQ